MGHDRNAPSRRHDHRVTYEVTPAVDQRKRGDGAKGTDRIEANSRGSLEDVHQTFRLSGWKVQSSHRSGCGRRRLPLRLFHMSSTRSKAAAADHTAQSAVGALKPERVWGLLLGCDELPDPGRIRS